MYALRLAASEPRAVGNQGVGAEGGDPISLCNSHKDNGCLFHDESVLDGFDPFDGACDLARLIDRVLRINETAQFNDALTGFDADFKRLEKIIICQFSFYFGRDDGIIDMFPRACLLRCRCAGHKGGDHHEGDKKTDDDMAPFHSPLLLSLDLSVNRLVEGLVASPFI
jgi:hypothetical protein